MAAQIAHNSSQGPAVSVLVAAYQEDDYLRQALESVRAQVFRDLEVVIVDDANRTSTRQVVENIRDSRFRYFANENRLGPAGTHWRAMMLSRGRYLAVLNQDDLWKPQFLDSLVPALEADSSVVVAFSDHDIVDSAAQVLREVTDNATARYERASIREGLQRSLQQLFVDQSLPMAVAAVFRRDVIRADREPLFILSGPAYDLCLALFVCLDGNCAYYSASRLASYRVHPRSQTTLSDAAWAMGAALCWQTFSRAVTDPVVRRRSLRKASAAYASAARLHLLAGARSNARSCAARSMVTCPSPRGTATWLLSFASQRLINEALRRQ